jgi:Saccharopine dehydrogenase NADP binding domain
VKVVVIGGGGGIGRHVVAAAARQDQLSEVVVTDLAAGRARAAAQLAHGKGTAVTLDVRDSRALRRLFESAHAVLNCCGPAQRFALPVLLAAIRMGVPYLDITDDWEVTVRALELDGAARRAGVPAVVGCGASPGLTNILAACAMDRLDRVDSLITAWSALWIGANPDPLAHAVEGQPGDAALEHWLLQCSGAIEIWHDGQRRAVKPLQPEPVAYPGLDTATGWTVGHPEPLTLPRIKPLKRSVNVMFVGRETREALRMISHRIDTAALSVGEAARILAEHRTPTATIAEGPEASMPPLLALAEGERDGRRRRVGARLTTLPPGGMGGATATPLAVALALLLRDAIPPGVHAPESAFDRRDFLAELAPRCDPPALTDALVQVEEAAV